MPCDYKQYPKNWHLISRFIREYRAKNHCENCNIENSFTVLRGWVNKREVFQDIEGYIYDANTAEKIGADYAGSVNLTGRFITVVLTVAHLDQDITNNSFFNLKALCQRCHNRHDIKHRIRNRRKNRDIRTGQLTFNL